MDVAVIGGGASGIVAALSAARAGARVVLLEKMPRLGKKILASGNGRCNLCNDHLDASFYNADARDLVSSVFDQFGKKEILHFFKELGLYVTLDEGRVFPVTNQALSVLDVLEAALKRLPIQIGLNSEITRIQKKDGQYLLSLKDAKSIMARRVVLSGGGMSYPKFGSDGKAYSLATGLGHTLIDPVPSAVGLLSDDPWCAELCGQKICATVRTLIHDQTGPKIEGELLFTRYGLSGTAAIDASEILSIAINRERRKGVELLVDLVPWIHEDALRKELSLRFRKKWPAEQILSGLLPQKFTSVFLASLKSRNPETLANGLKKRIFAITGTRGFEEADFTAGGIDTREVEKRTLESKKARGLFLTGEILNVQGVRGGYNLAWAWASGFIAGREAAAGRG